MMNIGWPALVKKKKNGNQNNTHNYDKVFFKMYLIYFM